MIEPFQGLLLGLFFVSVGAGLDLSHLFARPVMVLAMAFGLIALKGLVVILTAPVFKVPPPVAREMALLLGPGGEFALRQIYASAPPCWSRRCRARSAKAPWWP